MRAAVQSTPPRRPVRTRRAARAGRSWPPTRDLADGSGEVFLFMWNSSARGDRRAPLDRVPIPAGCFDQRHFESAAPLLRRRRARRSARARTAISPRASGVHRDDLEAVASSDDDRMKMLWREWLRGSCRRPSSTCPRAESRGNRYVSDIGIDCRSARRFGHVGDALRPCSAGRFSIEKSRKKREIAKNAQKTFRRYQRFLRLLLRYAAVARIVEPSRARAR